MVPYLMIRCVPLVYKVIKTFVKILESKLCQILILTLLNILAFSSCTFYNS